ncbi:MAG: type II secretion system F family protein [Pseudobdellovibrionaceae bacterium]
MLSLNLIMLFAGLLLASYSIYLFASTLLATNTDKQSLSWASNTEPQKSKNPVINFSRPLVHQFTLQHALRITNPEYRQSIAKKILTSGLSRELNVDEFIGLQILWSILFPILIGLLEFSLQLGIPWFAFLCFIPVGFYLPIFHAKAERTKREINVRKNLPFFIDLLALSVEAGMDFFASIQMIVDKSRSDNVLAQEFQSVLRDTKLGLSKAQSLRGMANRLDMSEITSFMTVLIDSESTGSPISKVLKDQSEQMRLERFVQAEKAGANAQQMLMLPIFLIIVPAVFIMVLGPAALSFSSGGG